MRASLWAILLVPALAASPAWGRDCQVTRLEGEVVRIWNEGVWSPLTATPLPAGASKIETGAATRVEIRCDDGVVLTIGVATEVNLEVLSGTGPGPAEAILQLIRGIVGVVAPDPGPRRFQVRTPLAIASVRSTSWLVEHGAADGTAVFVRDGRVAVRGPTASVVLVEGEGITIEPDGTPGDVKVWGPPRIARSVDALGFGWR